WTMVADGATVACSVARVDEKAPDFARGPLRRWLFGRSVLRNHGVFAPVEPVVQAEARDRLREAGVLRRAAGDRVKRVDMAEIHEEGFHVGRPAVGERVPGAEAHHPAALAVPLDGNRGSQRRGAETVVFGHVEAAPGGAAGDVPHPLVPGVAEAAACGGQPALGNFVDERDDKQSNQGVLPVLGRPGAVDFDAPYPVPGLVVTADLATP